MSVETTAIGAGTSPVEPAGVQPTDRGDHGITTRMEVHKLIEQLVKHLGPTLVALLADVKDRKLPNKWAKLEGPTPRDESLRRLQAAHRSWVMIATAEGDHVARAWFIGANPRLEEQPPVVCLRDGRDADVLAAAKAFVDGVDD